VTGAALLLAAGALLAWPAPVPGLRVGGALPGRWRAPGLDRLRPALRRRGVLLPVAAVLGVVLAGPGGGVAALALAATVHRQRATTGAERDRAAASAGLAEALASFAAEVRVGAPPAAAAGSAGSDAHPVAARVLALVGATAHLGGDVPAALAFEGLLDQALAESAAALGEERSATLSARRMLQRVAGRPETLVVAAQGELKSAPVALCATVPLEDPLGGHALPLIALLWVEPSLRQRGVARALVHETARLLAARGAGVLAARAGHNDDALISMGERWGFVRSWELLTREA